MFFLIYCFENAHTCFKHRFFLSFIIIIFSDFIKYFCINILKFQCRVCVFVLFLTDPPFRLHFTLLFDAMFHYYFLIIECTLVNITGWSEIQQNSGQYLQSEQRSNNHNANPESEKCQKYLPLAEPWDTDRQESTRNRMEHRRCHLPQWILNPFFVGSRQTLLLVHDMRALIYWNSDGHEQMRHGHTV